MNIGYFLRIFFFIPVQLCALPFAGFAPLHARPVQAAAEYREDLNRDGEANLGDLIHLLRLASESPGDPRVDFNSDGDYRRPFPAAQGQEREPDTPGSSKLFAWGDRGLPNLECGGAGGFL